MNNSGSMLTQHKLLITGACLFCIVLIGLSVRLEDLRDWQQQPEISFFSGEPLLTTIDGYYYLRLARDLTEGNYQPIDTLRKYPEPPTRPFPAPLLSVLTAFISKIGHFSINWVGVLLPPFLGIMVIVPVFATGRFYGGTSMGIASSLMVVLSGSYLTRSSLGWLDTDCLNISFTMAGIYCCIKFSTLQSLKRYFYFVGFLTLYVLFLWWWDQTPQAVTAISMLPLLVSLVFFYRPAKKEGILFYGTIALLCLFILYWKGVDLPVSIAKKLAGEFHYISKQTNVFFPNVGQLVSEQEHVSIKEFAGGTVNNLFPFALALIGLAALFIKKPKKILFLAAPCILTVMTLCFSQRFIIFAVPVICLGFGYFISMLWQQHKKYPKTVILAPLIVLVTAGTTFQKGMTKDFWPINVAAAVTGMDYIEKNTPQNAVVFARWDAGYPIQYWARRPTIADGAFHGGEISVYNAIPPAAVSDRLAANFINFFVHRGINGFSTVYNAVNNDKNKGLKLIKKILTAGPDKSYEILQKTHLQNNPELPTIEAWQQFFFPGSKRPVYWFFDYQTAESAYWWFWLGTWDIELADGTHPRFRSFLRVRNNGNLVSNGDDIHGSLDKGTMTTTTRTTKIQSAEIITGYDKSQTIHYPITSENKDNFFSLFVPGQFATLQGAAIHDSVFSRLFIRHKKSPYFMPVKLQTPAYQIYLVKPDTLPVKKTDIISL